MRWLNDFRIAPFVIVGVLFGATSAGAQTDIVRNDELGIWTQTQTQPWSIATVWQIGVVNGDENYEFGTITSVALGPAGTVFLADMQNQNVRVYSARGSFVRTIGRRGRGPAEFLGSNGIAWDNLGRTWISDPFNGKYSVLDSAGNLLKSVRRPRNTVAHWNQVLAFDESGHLIDEFGPFYFHLVDTTGVVLDSVPRNVDLPRFPSLAPSEVMRLNGPLREVQDFRPLPVAALARDGSFWLARSDRLRLIHVSLTGDTLAIIETTHRQPELSPAERSRISTALHGTDLSVDDLQLGRQIVQSIIPLYDGSLLVQIEETPGTPSNLFDAFDHRGRFLGSIRSEFPFAVRSNPGVRGDTLLAVTQDAVGVNHVVRYQLNRGRGGS